jgi:hypothetical protein
MLVPVSYRGIGLNTVGRSVFFDYEEGGFNTPQYNAVTVDRVGLFPSQVRMQPAGKTFPLHVSIKSPDIQGQFDAVGIIFDPEGGAGTMLLRDCDGRLLRLVCTAQQIILPERHGRPLVVPLYSASPMLQDNALTTLTDTIDGITNPIVFAPNNIGSANALPTLKVTPRQRRTAAQAYTKMREVTYCNRSTDSLTGPGSGTWLIDVTAGGGLTIGTEADKRDIAIFVDGIQLPPEKVRLDTGTGKIWIELADAPAQVAYLELAAAAGDLTLTFRTADHGFKAGDYIVRGAGTAEVMRVQSVDGDVVTVLRGQRGTVASAPAAGEAIYRSGHHIQIAWARTGLPVRPTDPDPPLINLATSTNLLWEWTTAPIWPDGNRRPGGWRRILYDGREDLPELRKNRLSAKTVLDFVPGAPATNIRFSDLEPTAAKPNFDALEFRACCGIDDAAGAIEYDATLGWPFCMQWIGRDALGLDSVVFNRLGHETGSAHFPPRIYTNQTEQPVAVLRSLILRARQIIVTTCRPSDTFAEDLAGVCLTGMDVQGLRLDDDTQIIGIVARAKDASGNAGLALTLNRVANTADTVDVCTPTEGGPGARLAGPFSGAGGLGGAFIQVCFFPSPAAAFTTDIPVVPAGDAFLGLYEVTPGSGNIQVPRSNGSIYARGSHWEFDGTDWIENDAVNGFDDLWFAILSLTSDNQEEAVETERSGDTLVASNIKLTFNPDETPIVVPRGEEDCYYFDDSWVINAGTTLRLRYLKRWNDALDNTIEINVEENTATDLQNGDNIHQCLTIEASPWLPLPPRVSALTITANGGAVEEDHAVEFRSTWQA